MIKAFEDKLKAKKESEKRKKGHKSGSLDEGPSPKKAPDHPEEDARPRGFDRGLQVIFYVTYTDVIARYCTNMEHIQELSI